MRRMKHSPLMGKRAKRAVRKSKPSNFSPELPDSAMNIFPVFRQRTPYAEIGRDVSSPPNKRRQSGCAPFTIPHYRMGVMDYRFISEVMGGARRLLRIPSDSVRKTKYRRKALAPGTGGRPLWKLSTVWLVGTHNGYSQSTSLRKMEDETSKSTWKEVRHSAAKTLREAGEQPLNDRTVAYPAGTPLRAGEIRLARNYRPRSIDGANI